MKSLRGKVALVTGAGSGIGRATAQALADEGASLILCDLSAPRLEEVARAHGSRVLLSQVVDVSSRPAMEAFAEEVHARVPAVDVLVNNAGVGLEGGVSDTTHDDWEWVLGVNLWGVIHGCRLFIPPMRRRGEGGHVVNLSSMLGLLGSPTTLGYSTTKFAVFGLSESLRAELQPEGIGVSTICPGMIATNIIQQTRFRSNSSDEAGLRARTHDTFQRRRFGPERVAAAIVDAIRQERDVVPVAPEAWLAYFAKRLAPALTARLSRVLANRLR